MHVCFGPHNFHPLLIQSLKNYFLLFEDIPLLYNKLDIYILK